MNNPKKKGLQVISFMSLKGGSGKSTFAINAAAVFSRLGRTVLIDTDINQLTAMTWATLAESKDFDVINIDPKLLQSYIERNEDYYDYMIIDCPPRADKNCAYLINNSHLVVIPVQPSPYDVWATQDLIDLIEQRQELTKGIEGLPPGGLPIARFALSNVDRRHNIQADARTALADTSLPVLDNMTTHYDVYKRAPMEGQTIFECQPKHKACIQIEAIVTEIIDTFEKEYSHNES